MPNHCDPLSSAVITAPDRHSFYISPPTPIIGRLALRVPRGKPAHHLWNNNGTWWVQYSIRHPEGGIPL